MRQPKVKLESLQGLRAIAALAVFMFHLVPYLEIAGADFFTLTIYRFGFYGVDIFFVLSGFVLSLSTSGAGRTGFPAAKRYYIARLWRIYSGYLPFLLLMLLVNTHFSFERAADDNIIGSLFLVETRPTRLVLGVSWTLTYELYFYALFCSVFLLPTQAIRYLLASYSLSVLSFHYFIVDTEIHSSLASFILSPYVLEFFLGCLTSLVWRRGSSEGWTGILWLATAILFFIGISVLQVEPDDELGRFLTFGIASVALILALASTDHIRPKWLGRGLVRLGDASYTLYLSHIIFIDVAHQIGFFSFLGHETALLSNLGAVAFVFFVCVFSIFFYRIYERPAYLRIKSWH